MGHLIKYRLKQILRDWSIMFWALAFPLILGTFFYIAFGNGNGKAMSEDLEQIKVAVVETGDSSQNAGAFKSFLEELDEETLEISSVNEAEAIKMLKADEIGGIYYVDQSPSLTVAKSDLEQSILKALLDNYNQNAGMISEIAEAHPEQIQNALLELGSYEEMTTEVDLGGKKQDPNVTYFFSLIAFACLSGTFLGIRSSFDSQANLTPLGARRSVTPTHKLKLVLSDMAVMFGVHLANVLLVTLYIHFVLGISLGDNPGKILLVDLLGSMIGVSLGIMIGCFGKYSIGIKMGISVAVTLFPAFLAGLMFGNMKDIIEHTVPIINRLNPAAVLSDAFYCMGIYDDPQRFARNLITLGAMSILFIAIAFFKVRRERYDSI